MGKKFFVFLACVGVFGHGSAAAQELNDVRSATARGLALVKRAGSNWHEHQSCFSCHHQTLPMLTMLAAARAGFPVDKEWLKSQADNAHQYFQDRIDDMDEGDHVPGGAATVGYGLWALSLDQRPPDKTTTAMVAYLLQVQGVQRLKSDKPSAAKQPRDGRWIASCRRAPLQGSEIGDTVLVLMGLQRYATEEQQPKVAAAQVKAETYLSQATLRHQQDRLWRLWGLHHFKGDAETKAAVRAAIDQGQHSDGGWSQTDDQASDAYSTGQTLYMLCQCGTSLTDSAVQRARDYLLKTQMTDGSWLVESRVKNKAQPYFDNGDPHGEHQFISTAAACWATAGLAQFLPPAAP